MSEAFTKDVLQVYAEKNEKGEFVTDEADPTQIKIPEANRDEFIKAQIGFGSREFTIQRAKLNYLELGTQLQLSVPELAILSPMLLDETGENDNVVALPTASQPAPGA